MVIPREPRLFINEGGDSVETTRQHLLQTTKAYLLGAIFCKNCWFLASQEKSFVEDEDIVHAPRKREINMNKVSVLEGADGSPPF